ncbi:DNA modification methylase [Elizabethkingia anophelis]|uniref:DNA modification methylase n=1 Tax=Elizabethkingia miricola TaxID=172045 RepID=UPI000998EFE1|nr:DNA modification methylase [Elizabethkingia miricola]MDV3567850.1 DNA modification methylase [Elizabethkingia anophelis]MDV3633951.1 DNA modification methylase [Elizabethkingia anophelis]MDV3708802.1 DNA modification methylase [Elizabethkingia anophelis]MDV3732279.1 DNA modification methylase [Elizabethkingia anophelis]MDV3735656.1 DNA modification methylase [Elizabethkingia anophelis]
MFEIKDYSKIYNSIMQFDKNKSVSIHQWYPFVEGYSKEFIESILNEINYLPENVLEPFSGSGTTALELQFKSINCTSFEVSPFMHLLSSVKLYKSYNADKLKSLVQSFKTDLSNTPKNIRKFEKIPFGRTVIKTDKLSKWNFNDNSLNGILDIKYAISKIEEVEYKNLFRIALASILLEVSNLFRNGKCLSYKKDWQKKIKFKRIDIHNIFLSKIENIILKDIELLTELNTGTRVNNFEKLYFGDVRKNILLIPDSSMDLIITSPPYLNSRDYTDIYMLELKILDLINNYEELSSLRKSTIRSHVQVKYGELALLNLPTLKKYINKISRKEINLWNNDLLNMIKGYFLDMEELFTQFKRVMKPNKYIYFNVANSAYFGEEIKVDEIISELAIEKGFNLIEIRKARDLKSSSQQSNTIKNLRESVIILKS